MADIVYYGCYDCEHLGNSAQYRTNGSGVALLRNDQLVGEALAKGNRPSFEVEKRCLDEFWSKPGNQKVAKDLSLRPDDTRTATEVTVDMVTDIYASVFAAQLAAEEEKAEFIWIIDYPSDISRFNHELVNNHDAIWARLPTSVTAEIKKRGHKYLPNMPYSFVTDQFQEVIDISTASKTLLVGRSTAKSGAERWAAINDIWDVPVPTEDRVHDHMPNNDAVAAVNKGRIVHLIMRGDIPVRDRE
jgi:hypothetical protein